MLARASSQSGCREWRDSVRTASEKSEFRGRDCDEYSSRQEEFKTRPIREFHRRDPDCDWSQLSERIVVSIWKILANTFVTGECGSVIIQRMLLSLLIISVRSLAGQAPEDIGPEVLLKSCLKKPQLVNFPRPRKCLSLLARRGRCLSGSLTYFSFYGMRDHQRSFRSHAAPFRGRMEINAF
jgi:hypothetical protein